MVHKIMVEIIYRGVDPALPEHKTRGVTNILSGQIEKTWPDENLAKKLLKMGSLVSGDEIKPKLLEFFR